MSRLKIIAVEEVPLQDTNIYLKESFFVLMLQVGAFFFMPKAVYWYPNGGGHLSAYINNILSSLPGCALPGKASFSILFLIHLTKLYFSPKDYLHLLGLSLIDIIQDINTEKNRKAGPSLNISQFIS